MILQALTQLYEDLLARGEIPPLGWSAINISYALCLGEDGQLEEVVPTLQEVDIGKGKTALRPQVKELPAAVKRAYGILSNFLWDNSSYMLGLDEKGKPERSVECFEACRALHHSILDGVDTPVAKAILRYFDAWQPAEAAEHPALAPYLKEILKGANLMFRVSGMYAQEDPAIRAAWQTHYDMQGGAKMQCLVTGNMDSIAAVHPAVSGVRGAQSSGAALVSFNSPAFCSYGREQGFNAPVGKYAAFAYTAALNHLLSGKDNVQFIGDTTVVCWAEGAEPAYTDFACSALFGAELPQELTEQDLSAMLNRLANGLPCTELPLDPNRPFYILGLAPNAARLSVRFFLRDTFGALMRHVNDHHTRMEIIRPANDPYTLLPLWAMLRETVNLNSRDKSPSPAMAAATARAIFTGGLYPASLLEATMLRIRAEHNITRGRAAILKAYYLRNENKECPKEVLTVSLNEASTNIPYTLGRLFSVYEAVQQAANPGINTTIKDKYYNSTASTPATIFPILDGLCQKHLRKLGAGQRIYYEKQIMELKNILGEENPLRLTLPQQGSFNLGYYHQTQKRYQKKEEQ
ncbi:MAG: type I-C CRISPR-associated protein Cas8c/Csd1 [bacterium]|nr:type I-C CRISPR-associated protein Cas8c/Csd1 [bacterium]